VRYIDLETNQYIAENVGKCNRDIQCGYHYTPKQYFEKHGNTNNEMLPRMVIHVKKPLIKPVSFIEEKLLKQSMQESDNCFTRYLKNLFGDAIMVELIHKYFIGTSKHWAGANVFWQVDVDGKIRTGKVMLYSPDTGKRVKEPFNHISWVHSLMRIPDYNLRQCLFGEHLLFGNDKPVALVESEKTAIIASVYLPQFIWLAAGSKDGLTNDKCKVLKGRKVVLYPDLQAFDEWDEKAKNIPEISNYRISELLEKKATETERAYGLDLADFLIRFKYVPGDNINNVPGENELVNSYANEFQEMAKRFNACEISFSDYKNYTNDLSGKLKSLKINLETFIKYAN
jgi:hypothetical protein